MNRLTEIAETIHQSFEARTQRRDQALLQARKLTRMASLAIRAVHRSERQEAETFLANAGDLLRELKGLLAEFADLYFAGYTQDAIKEYVEARSTFALIYDLPLPDPDQMEVEYATYLNGLAEVTGELRRRCLDILRQGYSQEAEILLHHMDEIYAVLVTMDYPDAITQGLRRQTDLVRGILERTRGDLTLSLREEQLKQSMASLEQKLAQTLDAKKG